MQRIFAAITLSACSGLLSTCAAPADPSARPVARAPAQAPGQASWWEGELLFPFGRSSLDDLPAEDRERLHRLAASIRAHAGTVERITVTGHSDRIGSTERKHQRSLDRARAVAALFEAGGVDPSRIAVVARSDADADAGAAAARADSLPAAKLLQCLASDREVTVQATARSKPPRKAAIPPATFM